jgi:peptidoglycan L-alanyl-D-glutamate endopeptidase CwlK
MASRKVSDLVPAAQHACDEWLALCRSNGLDILITCTYRSPEEQNELYAYGRTKPGPKRTNARGGQSAHQWRTAIDFCVMVNGKPDWDDLALYKKAGALAKQVGFEYAGEWRSFREFCHIQLPNKPVS